MATEKKKESASLTLLARSSRLCVTLISVRDVMVPTSSPPKVKPVAGGCGRADVQPVCWQDLPPSGRPGDALSWAFLSLGWKVHKPNT